MGWGRVDANLGFEPCRGIPCADDRGGEAITNDVAAQARVIACCPRSSGILLPIQET